MRKPSHRALVTVAAAVTVLAGGVAVRAAVADAATAGCTVSYRVTNQWTGGFGADVTVTNLGSAVTGWTVAWSFTAGQTVTQAWNATVTQSGAAVSAASVSYNGALATGAGTSFGFNGSWTGSNPVPASFTMNGTTCDGGTTSPDPTPCPSPSVGAPSSTTPPASPSASAPVKVWLAGDSTVAAPSSTCPVGWGAAFSQYFNSSVTVVNSAVAGRSIQTWLYDPNVTTTMGADGECVISPMTYSTRWQAMLDASTGMKAGDWLFIQFGINDGSTTCNRHVGPARYQQLLGVMAQAALARGAHPVFITAVAAITCSGSSAVGNRGFLTETRNAAAANGVPVIDLHALSVTLYNTLRLCPNDGDYTAGAVGAFFCNDHTHFEADGARQIAGLVATAVRNQGIGLAGYLK